VVDISKTLADGRQGGRRRRRQSASATSRTLIDARAVKLADTLGERIATIDSTLGKGALDVANTLDGRIGQFGAAF